MAKQLKKGPRMKRSSLWLVAAALLLPACKANVSNTGGQASNVGIDASWMDNSVKPGDDFFSYADGSWVKNTQIPADRSRIGAFWIADLQREKNTRELFDGILKSNPTSGNDALIANYYNAYLDTGAIDRAGVAPAKGDLDAINAITNKRGLSAAIGSTLRADTDPINATNFHTDTLF